MLTTARIGRGITRDHRVILRKLPTQLLEEAYRQLLNGYGEQFACHTLGINPNIIKGTLQRALEETLWERGYFGKL